MDDGPDQYSVILSDRVSVHAVLHDNPRAVHVLAGYGSREHPAADLWPSTAHGDSLECSPLFLGQRLKGNSLDVPGLVQHGLPKFEKRMTSGVFRNDPVYPMPLGLP